MTAVRVTEHYNKPKFLSITTKWIAYTLVEELSLQHCALLKQSFKKYFCMSLNTTEQNPLPPSFFAFTLLTLTCMCTLS